MADWWKRNFIKKKVTVLGQSHHLYSSHKEQNIWNTSLAITAGVIISLLYKDKNLTACMFKGCNKEVLQISVVMTLPLHFFTGTHQVRLMQLYMTSKTTSKSHPNWISVTPSVQARVVDCVQVRVLCRPLEFFRSNLGKPSLRGACFVHRGVMLEQLCGS